MSKRRIVFREHGVAVFRDEDRDDYGIQCSFFNENGVGYKLYESRYRRDYCWRRQLKASHAGLGPEVGPRFCATEAETGKRWWGYVTEVVKLAPANVSQKRLDKLIKDCEKLFHLDFHGTMEDYIETHNSWARGDITNVGIKNRRLVLIGFGPESI